VVLETQHAWTVATLPPNDNKHVPLAATTPACYPHGRTRPAGIRHAQLDARDVVGLGLGATCSSLSH
jgi:hypothetical protein